MHCISTSSTSRPSLTITTTTIVSLGISSVLSRSESKPIKSRRRMTKLGTCDGNWWPQGQGIIMVGLWLILGPKGKRSRLKTACLSSCAYNVTALNWQPLAGVTNSNSNSNNQISIAPYASYRGAEMTICRRRTLLNIFAITGDWCRYSSLRIRTFKHVLLSSFVRLVIIRWPWNPG